MHSMNAITLPIIKFLLLMMVSGYLPILLESSKEKVRQRKLLLLNKALFVIPNHGFLFAETQRTTNTSHAGMCNFLVEQ